MGVGGWIMRGVSRAAGRGGLTFAIAALMKPWKTEGGATANGSGPGVRDPPPRTLPALVFGLLLLGASFAISPPTVSGIEVVGSPGEGHCFAVTNSTYLNVTLCTTQPVNVTLGSVPRVVTFTIQAVDGAPSTDITLSGLGPNESYYRHQDGYVMEM